MPKLKTLMGVMSLGAVTSLAFAEPPIQPGDTLESLSQVKIETTVNGQAGSLEQMGITKELIAQAISQNAVIDLQTRTLLPSTQAQPSTVVEPQQVANAPMEGSVNDSIASSAAIVSTADVQAEGGLDSTVNQSVQQVEPTIEQGAEQVQAQAVETMDTAVAEQQAQVVAANAQQLQATENITELATAVENKMPEVTTDSVNGAANVIPVEAEQAVAVAESVHDEVNQGADNAVNTANLATEKIEQQTTEMSAQTEPVVDAVTDEVAAVEAQVEQVDPNAQALPANPELPDSSAQLNEEDVGTVTPQ